MTAPLRLGTRGSRLALWQANFVADLLRPLTARAITLVEIQTAGDQVRDAPLPQIGGEGVFTKEIQRALLAGLVDVAVHSLKDLPTIPVDGLVLVAVPPRGPTGDALVSHRHSSFDRLPEGAVVATGSLRRQAQLRHRRPDLRLINIRGNVETRLRKLSDEGLDALVLAQAGLERLGMGEAVVEVMDQAWMLPAVGQGALGLECRADDHETSALVEQVDHLPSHRAVRAERSLLRGLGGGCQMPLGVVTAVQSDRLHIRAAVLDPGGTRRIEAERAEPAERADAAGRQLARDLLERGARDLLRSLAPGEEPRTK